MDYIEGDLYDSVLSSDTRRLRSFLDKGLSPNYVFRVTDIPDRLGKTILEIAVCEKNTEVITLLMERGCNPNLTYIVETSRVGYIVRPCKEMDRLKQSVMFRCIVQADIETIKMLVDGGFDVNVVDDRGCTAIWHAVDLDNYEMVKILLTAKGRDVNRADRTRLRPLHIAAIHGNPRILSLLLRNGAEVDAVQLRGSTPLCLSCHRGDFESVRYLLLNGANPNHMGYNGHTPLSSAIKGQFNIAVIGILIESGARVSDDMLRTCQEQTPSIFKKHSDVLLFLKTLSSTPQNLQLMCNLKIRKCLMESPNKTDILKKSNNLPLPKSLRNYIILDHLIDASIGV